MKIKFASLAILSAASLAAAAALPSTPRGFTDDLDAALKRAAANGHRVVAVFSGSDWCIWCQRLEGEILSKDEFLKTATNKYELVFIDNPMDDKILPPRIKSRNSALTRKYDVQGFPTVLVLDASGKAIATLGYEKDGPAKFLSNIEWETRIAPYRKDYINPLEAILARPDKTLREELDKQIRKEFPNPRKRLSKKEQQNQQMQIMKLVHSAIAGEAGARHIALCEKALEEARAFAVPAQIEDAKAKMIETAEKELKDFKATRAQAQAKGKSA